MEKDLVNAADINSVVKSLCVTVNVTVVDFHQ